MQITLTEAITALKKGDVLKWNASGAFKASFIHLESPEQRRLVQFLLEADQDKVSVGDEALFSGLHETWADKQSDTIQLDVPESAIAASGPWRLTKIESKNFGGLNGATGPKFEMKVDGENWCLEGHNGSGKTSLANLIIWTLTGYRSRDEDGPVLDRGIRAPVSNTSGNKIGTWPPIATYPDDVSGLHGTATVSGKLLFVDPNGNVAIAERTIESPVNGDAVVTEIIDPRLLSSPELIETGLLMPARIAHIGFGDKSQRLHQALKMLTGLDQLSAIASGAAALGHKARRFLKYAKDNGSDTLERDFTHNYSRAKELAEGTEIDLSHEHKLGDDKLIETLSEIGSQASKKAGEALNVLSTEINNEIDLTKQSDRDALNRSVSKARHILSDGTKGILFFDAMDALTNSKNDAKFKDIGLALIEAEFALEEALKWNSKQQIDEKLRLKAMASKFLVPVISLSTVAECPLCETHLTSDKQKTLAGELRALKADAVKAERSIADACKDITQKLILYVPSSLQIHIKTLADIDPADAFKKMLNEQFVQQPPFKNALSGISKRVNIYANDELSDLPSMEIKAVTLAGTGVDAADKLTNRISLIRRVSELSNWWHINSVYYSSAWNNLIGIANDNNEWPVKSLEGKLATLENSIQDSVPLDQLATHIVKAKLAVETWEKIHEVQQEREAIAEAVKPLKELQHLVECETHRTVETLSDRVQSILGQIQLNDRITFSKTAMSKKAVSVEASVVDGLNVDAVLVANSSWMRALLWAFIFALREQTIAELGCNSFPLVVLDDPQTTFDPKNKRKWAEMIVSLANAEQSDVRGMQLFLATHERQFFDMIYTTCDLLGQEGKVAKPTKFSKVAHIINGTYLKRKFEEVCVDKDDDLAFEYIQQVRVYCEDLFKIMLRPQAYEVNGETLGGYCTLLSALHNDHIAPYNQRPFQKLTQLLNQEHVPVMKIVNAPHHANDGTIGYAQAVQVEKYWSNKLERAFINAFRLASDFDAYGGTPPLFAWEDNVVQFPQGYRDELKAISLETSGVSAVALSDGLVGDGQIELEQAGEPNSITLVNHRAYILNSGTFDPVAGIGDVLLVQGYGNPRSKNLVVATYGDKIFARRMNESDNHSDIVILTGQATDPYALPDPIVALKSKVELGKVIGVIYRPKSIQPPSISQNEVIGLNSFSMVENCLNESLLMQVKGRSMEPVALDGQYVVTKDEILNEETLNRLDGELVIAVDNSGGVYFKRLRRHAALIVLESINSSGSTSSEILSLMDHPDHKRLITLKAVVGVLFELPKI